MDEDGNGRISSSSNENEIDNIKAFLQKFDNISDADLMKANEQMAASNVVFEELLRKIEEVHKSQNDRRDRIRQGISLCIELIDAVQKATCISLDIVQKCWGLLQDTLLTFDPVLFEKDEKSFVREIFFASLDLLSKPTIRSYLNADQDIETRHEICYKSFTRKILQILVLTAQFISFTHNDATTRTYNDLLCIMYKRVKRDLQHGFSDNDLTDEDMETTDLILRFFWNLAAVAIIVPWFLGIGLIKSMTECLKIKSLPADTVHKIICILHNIARHDDGIDELRRFNGSALIKSLLTLRVDDFEEKTDLILSMTVALLSTSEEIRADNKRKNRILNQLLQMTIDAAESKDHYAKRGSEVFHVSAPLAVFAKLFVDDRLLEYVLDHAETEVQSTVSSTINLFVKLLLEFRGISPDIDHLKQFTCTALLNILWSISFHDRYKPKLQESKDLLKIATNIAENTAEPVIVDQYIPHSMESMASAANGILYNIQDIGDEEEANATSTNLVSEASDGKPMIMISYAHADNQFCDRILAELDKKENPFHVLIDRKFLLSSANIWVKIARAIRQSTVVVLLLSQKYFDSKSCRCEANFAIKRGKPLVPVHIGKLGDCDWLDIQIDDPKYVRFKETTGPLNRATVQEMLRTIQATIKENQTHSSQEKQQHREQHVVPAPPRQNTETPTLITVDIKKPSEEWTPDDIHRWFDSHKVPDTLVKLFDFQSLAEMHRYASKLQTDSNAEFLKYKQSYAKNNAGDELEEYIFVRFENALFSLPNNYSGTMKTSMPSHQTSPAKSSACTIL